MAYTEDQIKQLAANRLGFDANLDWTDTEDEAIVKINYSYELIKKSVLSSYRWGFAIPTVDLTSLQEDVTDEKYTYRYPVPADMLSYLTGYMDQQRNVVLQDYEVYQGYIYCNAVKLYLMYIKDEDEDQFPDYFVNYLKIKLAYDVCFDITGDTDLLMLLAKEEQSEGRKAKNIDARQRRTKVIRSAPYLSVRGMA